MYTDRPGLLSEVSGDATGVSSGGVSVGVSREHVTPNVVLHETQ